MKILSFHAENIKGLKVVDLKPNGNDVVLSGKNGSGKSSILDCIEKTLVGGDLDLRPGTEKGMVAMSIGDYTIQRVITGKTDRLIIKNKDGATYGSPRAFLEKLIGPLSIDPTAFVRLGDRDQLTELFKLCPDLQNGLTAADKKIADIKAERSSLMKEKERAELVVTTMPTHADAPDFPISTEDVLAEINQAIEHNRTVEQKEADARRMSDDVAAKKTRLTEYQQDVVVAQKAVESAQRRLAEAEGHVATLQKTIAEAEQIIEAKQQEAINAVKADTTALTAKLNDIEAQNKKMRENEAVQAKKAEIANLAIKITEKYNEAKKAEADKAALFANAKMPIAGLTVTDAKVMYNNAPVSELSTAEKVRVGAAIAVAQNPKAKIILCDNLSLLDSNSMKVLAETCAEFQMWQVINDESGKVGIFIEDGTIQAAPEVAEQGALPL